jgi:choline dehydrogenase-like flavoprotein
MKNATYDVVVVGSGAGGATLARELIRKKLQNIVILEKGKRETSIGTLKESARYYDSNAFLRQPTRSKEGVILWRTLMAGGSTFVSCGNGVRCLESELKEHGIELSEEFTEAEKEMKIKPMKEEKLSEGTLQLREAAKQLGYAFDPMPKFIDLEKCTGCGGCVFGCVRGAKWTAMAYLDEVQGKGVDIRYGHEALSIETSHGRVSGVTAKGPEGLLRLNTKIVVLAAGGLGTPIILQKAGIQGAGEGLFIDTLVNTYGATEGLNQLGEPPMALVDHEFQREKGFILSSYMNHPKGLRFLEMGAKALTQPSKTLLGIMTKTADDSSGRVLPDGSVQKGVTDADRKRLDEGASIATEILKKAGVRASTITTGKPQGAHLGGTAAIGRVVDKQLQTDIDGLFVCDASVLPHAPGLPPILTIVALAKRLAKTLS